MTRFVSRAIQCATCDVVICYANWSSMIPCLYCRDCAEKIEQEEAASDAASEGGETP
jgi:late competence protein required for DNA uptake (superfamily II DNA/RNA helicase)